MAIQHNVKTRSTTLFMMYGKLISYLFIKRIIDILFSFILIVLLTPIFIIIAYKVYKKEGSPIFHREARAGQHNNSFIMWTFRTKTIPSQVIRSLPPRPVPVSWDNGVPNDFKVKVNDYTTITTTGSWLLKYKLHKLPLLFHVLKGDMSLVGPQAEIKEITKYYNEYQKKRLQVKPGITGYAQINHFTNKSHRQKIIYDLYYVRNFSLKFDIQIMFQALKLFIV